MDRDATSDTARVESPLPEGTVIDDRYRIGSPIGDGGMGIVVAATHIGLGVPLALKLIRPELARDAEVVRRFVNEARAAAALQSEHVARVHDVGELPTGEPYLVMERLEGIDLETFAEVRGRLDPREAADLVLQACEGLAAAHARGLVHRDIKPANLFLARSANGSSVVKILDFGISKWTLGEARKHLTQPGGSLGSPWYMSPEQMANASTVDPRTDIWSLGVVLYRLIAGELPFDGIGVPEVCAKVLIGEPQPLSAHRPDIDPELDAIVQRCLERDRERRYPSVRALANDLARFGSRSRDSISADANDSAERSRPPRSRTRRIATSAVASALLATIAGGALWMAGAVPQRLPWDPALAPDTLLADVDRSERSRALDANWLRTPPTGREPAPQSDALQAPRDVPEAHATSGEPVLSAEKIERRRRRYQLWLAEQGLQSPSEALTEIAVERELQ